MLWGDYHTHTTYSRHRHGKGTVADNVRAALSCGLKEIALTDHGLRHITYGMTTKNLPRFLAESARLSVSAALSGCTEAPSRRRVFRVRLSVSDQAYARQAQPPRTALSVTTAIAFS